MNQLSFSVRSFEASPQRCGLRCLCFICEHLWPGTLNSQPSTFPKSRALKVSSEEQRGPGRGFHGELHLAVFADESLFLSGMPRLVRPDFRSRQRYA